MADYHPLIARAVAGLDKNTGENRRALYDRARTALVNQLRGVEPPLEESDITRERLALEEAIRRLEVEAAKRKPDAAGPTPAVEDRAPSLRDQGLRDFRDTVAEAEGLGDAAAEANRSARTAYEEMRGDAPLTTPAVARIDNDRLHDDARDHESAAARDEQADSPSGAGNDTHYFDRPVEGPSGRNGEQDYAGDKPHGYDETAAEPHEMPAAMPQPRGTYRGTAANAPHEDDDDIYTRPQRNWGRVVTVVVLLLVIAGLAGAGFWQRELIVNTVTTTLASLHTPTSAPSAPTTTQQPVGRPKIEDRIGAGNGTASSPSTAPAAAVAQKVVLYDEDPGDPKGKRYVGSAVWRTETVSPGPGLAPELAIRADVEIPERRMRMTWSLRRNTDKALPASHTIEIMFTLPADFSEGGIANVPGVLMKQNEQARGVPLAGLAVKVTNGYFLIGLSSVSIDQQRNIQLLKERDWFDIPIVYTNGKRAILAVEKGTPGGRAFEEAFRAWGE